MRNPFRPLGLLTKFVVPAVLAFLVLGPSSAHAQSQPLVSYVLPAGGQRGTTAEIAVRGRYLIGATGVYISGKGVTGKVVEVTEPDKGKRRPQRLDAAKYPHQAQLAIAIAPDAQVGERDLRIITPGGISNRFRFFVGQAPEVVEPDESDKLSEEAIVLESLPAVANGQIFQADSDAYRFKAKAGKTLVFDVDAQLIINYIADGVPGWFQPSLRLNDAQGNELAYVDDFLHHPDPLMIYKVPKDGEYEIEIKDVLYRGRSDFVYRLTVGTQPVITHIFPLGGKRNSQVAVQLGGVNLPQDKLKVAVPADSPNMRFVGGVTANGMTSNVTRFAAGNLAEAFETEPNNLPEQANRVEFPLTVNGLIQSDNDVDHFVFTAKARQALVLEVFAKRLDSPLDSTLTVHYADGRAIRSNDDTIDNSAGHVTQHTDSYLAYTFPRDDDYLVSIADTQDFGGDAYAYRLTIKPQEPDYELHIRPDNPRTPQGSMTFFTVTAFRKHGFNSAIDLSVKGVPKGFAVMNVSIPERQTFARVPLSAPLGSPIGLYRPKVVGTAINDRAKADLEAGEKAVAAAVAAAAKLKTAADNAATAQTNTEKAAATRRQQANDAKKKLSDLQAQQKTSETTLATVTKAVTDTTNAKTAADKALAVAKTATTGAKQAQQAAEKVAQQAAAAAKAVAGDAAKSPAEKKKAADDAAAKRKAADAAKAALTAAQQKEQQAQAQVAAAAKNLPQAAAKKETAERALTNIKNQVAAAARAVPTTEAAAKKQEAAAAKAKAATEKARAAHAAAEQDIVAKRKAVEEAKARLAIPIVRKAISSEEKMQAFYYMHSIPTKEFLLSVLERGPFALASDLPPGEALKLTPRGYFYLTVTASFKEGVKPDTITLRPSTTPREWRIEAPPIPAGQTQSKIKITTFGNKYIRRGQRGNLIFTARMKVGKSIVSGFVPAIPYEIH